MSTFTIELDDAVSDALVREAEENSQTTPDRIRQLLTEHAAQRAEAQRFMAELAREAKALANDPEAMRESKEIAEDFLEAENEALSIAEGRDPEGALAGGEVVEVSQKTPKLG